MLLVWIVRLKNFGMIADELQRLPVVFVCPHYLMVVEGEGTNRYALRPNVTAFF
jgi:hypothetical protein